MDDPSVDQRTLCNSKWHKNTSWAWAAPSIPDYSPDGPPRLNESNHTDAQTRCEWGCHSGNGYTSTGAIKYVYDDGSEMKIANSRGSSGNIAAYGPECVKQIPSCPGG